MPVNFTSVTNTVLLIVCWCVCCTTMPKTVKLPESNNPRALRTSFANLSDVNLDSLNVLAINGLKLRERPSQTSQAMHIIPYGARVEVVEWLPEKIKFGWIEGNWVKAAYKESAGYIFSAYLSKLPPPPLTRLPKRIYEIYEFPQILEDYAAYYLLPTSKKRRIDNEADGENSHSQIIQQFEYDITFIRHSYWEGNGAEIIVRNTGVFEGFVVLNALLYPSESTRHLFQRAIYVKNKRGKIIEIHNPIDNMRTERVFVVRQINENDVSIYVEYDI